MKSLRDFGIDLPDRFHGDRKTTCPKCSESRRNKHEPCLSVNGDEGIWKCHHCGWTGTIHEGEHHEYRPQRKIYRRPAYTLGKGLAEGAFSEAEYNIR